MFAVIMYFGIWRFVASFFESTLAKCLWIVFWFAPIVWQLVAGNKKPVAPKHPSAKPQAAVNPSEPAPASLNSGGKVPKLFSKAVPESAVKFPVQNRAGRIVPFSFRKGIPESALVMAPRNIRP